DGYVTDQTERLTNHWVGSWTAAMIIGAVTWGLMIWCIVMYRKRKGDNKLPVQLRYHVPLEILYTAIPVLLVAGLFYFTQRDISVIKDESEEPQHHIQVIGKQWAWHFNYTTADVNEGSIQAQNMDAGEW